MKPSELKEIAEIAILVILLLAILLLTGCAKMNGTMLYCFGMCLEVEGEKEVIPIEPIIEIIKEPN